MTNSILTAQSFSKSYGALQAVNGISLTLQRGEIFGLLGPNGAGKTTIISILAGLLDADQGAVLLDGQPLTVDSVALKAKIGLVPQELALYPTLSARENLNFFGRIYGMRGKRLRQRVDEVLAIVGLSRRANDLIKTYSGGMKRRINIAAGLLHKPEVLFLDEPTVGVDPQSRNAIFEAVEALNRAGLTILYTTHYMEEAQRLCHRVAIVDHGQIIALDTPQALIQKVGGGLIRLGLQNGRIAAVSEQVGQLPTVKSVSVRESELFVETHRAQEALLGIFEIANALDARVTSLQILEPNLETVFLQLTGKSLRD